jgi:hypothetical protein
MNQTSRPVTQVVSPGPVIEGAHAAEHFGTRGLDHLGPFLLFDHLESERRSDYVRDEHAQRSNRPQRTSPWQVDTRRAARRVRRTTADDQDNP